MQIGKVFLSAIERNFCVSACILDCPKPPIVWAFIAFHHRFDISPHATSSLTSPRFLFLHGIRIHKEISFSYFDERCRPFPFTLNCLLLVVVPRARKATHNTLHGKSHTRKLKGWHNSCFNFDETFEMKNVSKINEQKRQKKIVGTLTWTLGELQFWKKNFPNHWISSSMIRKWRTSATDWTKSMSFQFEMEEKCTQIFLCENRELYGSFCREMKINWTPTEKAKNSGTVEMCGGSGGGKSRERLSTCARVGVAGKWKSHVVGNSRLFRRRRKVDFVDSIRDIVAS